MNIDARRFLAVNCLLNGHSFMYAFDNDMDIALEAFGDSSKEEIDKFDKEICSYFSQTLEENALTMLLLNYFRVQQYAFMVMPTGESIMLAELADLDRKGKVDENTVRVVAWQLIRDIQMIKGADKDLKIVDGNLFLPEIYKEADYKESLIRAYELYRDGPANLKIFIKRNRRKFYISAFKKFTAEDFKGVVTMICKKGTNPGLCSKTTLHIPDLLNTYRKTGAICAESDLILDAVDAILPVNGSDLSTMVSIEYSDLKSLLLNSIQDLSTVSVKVDKNTVEFIRGDSE